MTTTPGSAWLSRPGPVPSHSQRKGPRREEGLGSQTCGPGGLRSGKIMGHSGGI